MEQLEKERDALRTRCDAQETELRSLRSLRPETQIKLDRFGDYMCTYLVPRVVVEHSRDLDPVLAGMFKNIREKFEALRKADQNES